MESPSLLSIVPPLLSLVLAVTTRNVLVSLGLGVYLGMTIHNGWNPFFGLLDVVERGVFAQLAEASHAKVIIVIAVIGGFVRLLDRSGGMSAFARRVTRVVGSPVKAQLAVWLTGIAIFFTDSGNSLILGPMFRPIFSGLRVCREKLAFIIDSTSSPVCVLVPVISWGVYVMSLMEQSFGQIGLDENPLAAFVKVLPFQLYPILAILTVPVIVLSGREWGPMARAQARAIEAGADEPAEAGESAGASGRTIVVPMATMLLVLASLFGQFLLREGELQARAVQVSLVIAYAAGAVVCAALLHREGVFTWKQSFETFVEGMGRMVFIVVILLLAWSLGDVCELLGTGAFIATFFDGVLHPGLLPAIVFVLGAVLSLSTGSSWGTFALLMPIAVPVAHQLGSPMFVSIAAVLSGGMLGDHCSPVSDTTVLSSMSTGCEHADHVNTQLAYAAVTGLSALAGFLLAGFTGFSFTILLALALQVSVTLGLMRLFGTPLHTEPDRGA